MLPDDAVDRIAEGCRQIGALCKSQGIEQWEVVATQSYGHSIDIEAVSYTHLTLPTIYSV